MASASVKQPCVKCDKGFGKNMCIGCQQWFCNKHYNEHQEELAKEMENVTQKHDELHSHLTMGNMGSEHPLLVRNNEWEQQSIDRIRAVTNEARTKLKQSLDQVKQEIKTSLSQVADQFKSSRENEDYTEIDLKCWMDQLESLKQRLLNPPEIELHGDTQAETNASTIKLIELKFYQGPSK
jgi:predicted  nucleic acid-binding Zn-ribbon protein